MTVTAFTMAAVAGIPNRMWVLTKDHGDWNARP
jgi:hypothetical protein